MKILLLTFLCIPIIGFISCQNDSTADDLQGQIDEVKQNDLETNTPIVKDEQTRLEEKFPPSTNAIAIEKRVYFHAKPDETTILKSFIVSGQNCVVEKVENGFGYVSFHYKGKTTKGWLNLNYIDPYDGELANTIICQYGEEVTHGDDMYYYTTEDNICTFGNLIIKEKVTRDDSDCKFSCREIIYYLPQGESKVKVNLKSIFQNNLSGTLLGQINTKFKVDYLSLGETCEDCFEGVEGFSNKDFSNIELTLSDDGFHFSSNIDYGGMWCYGPCGKVYANFSIEEMKAFLIDGI